MLIGSGIPTREVVADDRLVAALPLDPRRQMVGSPFHAEGPIAAAA